MKNRLLPAGVWLARYERSWLKADVLAGLTTAAVVILIVLHVIAVVR